ncbi:MAG: TetR/AcrR family transcriptional regulator [Bacteroidales bacterium]|jgi:AcrR family transcriptional regulator|nr:TetR/AcrR family transcriptional regulator [Bacteroidales bacterium]
MTEDTNNGLEKKEILKNISEIFFRYGIRSCSMDDIARHLKISKKTLYGFFENKNDVVGHVMQYRRGLGDEMVDKLDFSKIEPIYFTFDKIDLFINKFNTQIPNNFYDIKKYHPDVYKKHFKKTDEHNLCTAIRFLDKGIADGIFRDNIDKELTIHIISRQIMSLADPDVTGEIETPIEKVIITILEYFIRSIATPKGVEQLERALKKRELGK